MPDVHLPHLDEHEPDKTDGPAGHASVPATHRPARAKSLLKIGLEVVLITTGVFLGLAGEQWRESRHHQELAETSLRRFKSEFQANRAEVQRVITRHDKELAGLLAYLREHDKELAERLVNPAKPIPLPIPETVTDVAAVDFSAWDVALATQSLVYLDPDLVARVSSTYRLQQIYVDAHRAIQQNSYSIANIVSWLNGVTTYFGDALGYERQLLKDYNDVLPRLDKAISER